MIGTISRTARGLRKPKRLGELVSCVRHSGQWPRLIPAYVLRSELPYPFEFSTRDQCRVILDNWDDLTTIWHVFFANEYYLPQDSRTIVDLGANIGAFTVWAANRCTPSRIFSFEPFPSTFEKLQSNINTNSLDSRVECVQMAVDWHDGIGRFESEARKWSYCRMLVAGASAVENDRCRVHHTRIATGAL